MLYAYICNNNNISQSNLRVGHVVTTGCRPTHSRRAQSFNRIYQVAPMCTPIKYTISLAYLIHHSKWQLDRFSSFFRPDAAFAYVTLCRPISPKIYPLPSRDLNPHQIHGFLDLPDPPYQINSVLINSAIFLKIYGRYQQLYCDVRLNRD